ncbi:MAG TPA: bifunctional glutamate N-acetyltransferase/amino-acid acetyltransferase ArgJ [Candidatus Krumholzibacteria bacterium]|nr:bifunctional glutamate N-acetyltransferase/amino-acid acetyltransferase ArgJ [Candidatus Krumholzibacteria bacterium]
MSTPVPAGFLFASGTAGIKASGKPDLAVIEAPQGATAAAMFTRNRVAAAPVVLGRRHVAESRGRLRAVVINAGNANCATGEAGLDAARRTCVEFARLLGAPVEHVLPSSTGIIGVPLPVEKLLRALPGVHDQCNNSAAALDSVAHAIMTTDTRPKMASASFCSAHVTGIAKGAGMIHPDMATMLVYVLTDAAASPALLRRALRTAVNESFNCISIDGDTSTNDTAVLMASGAAGVNASQDERGFTAAITDVCASLADQIVADGEGVQHRVTLRVDGAANHAAAARIARTVAQSLLVKTAWAGADPNWGRLLAAAGRAGVAIDPGAVDIWIAGQRVCAGGASVAFDADRAHRAMSEPAYEIRVRVGAGPGTSRVLTGDLTAEYVHINADYST